MNRTNRNWLPGYCDPEALLPKVPETSALFSRRPYLIQDFVGKLVSLLGSDEIAKTGFEYDPKRVVPCRWKCSDESLFGVDLALYAYTRAYPFDKGEIGGCFNAASIGAAVHHGSINIDIGGSHVGYEAGPGGGSFGRIWRPAEEKHSTDCGYLMGVLAPFQQVYRDASENILLCQPEGARPMVSIPNEYVQPTWSSDRIKLLVDLERFTCGEVEYEQEHPFTHTQLGRSLFHVHPEYLASLDPDVARSLCTPAQKPIGDNLTQAMFNIWDSEAELANGRPKLGILPYMKYILAARYAPAGLKAAIVNTALEHNQLTDAVRTEPYRPFDFVSFTGVFIDTFNEGAGNYVNLFQPMGLSVKPRGRTHEVSFSAAELHELLENTPLAEPHMALEGIFGHARPQSSLDDFTFEP